MTTSSRTSTRRRDAREALDQCACRTHLLERAVELLTTAAEAEDVDLAQTCRGVLDALHSERSTGAPSAESLPAPRWAAASIREDARIVHETVSPLHPTTTTREGRLQATDISLSVTDLLIDGRWIRTRPTIQLEGGSYPLASARQLRAALDELVTTEAGVSTTAR